MSAPHNLNILTALSGIFARALHGARSIFQVGFVALRAIATCVFFAVAVAYLSGCTVITTPYGSVYRFCTDSALESATIETPEGIKVQIGGYNSSTRIDAAIKLLEAAR